MFHLCTECGCSHTDKVILEALLSHQRTEAVVQKDDQRRRATSQACQQRHLLWGAQPLPQPVLGPEQLLTLQAWVLGALCYAQTAHIAAAAAMQHARRSAIAVQLPASSSSASSGTAVDQCRPSGISTQMGSTASSHPDPKLGASLARAASTRQQLQSTLATVKVCPWSDYLLVRPLPCFHQALRVMCGCRLLWPRCSCRTACCRTTPPRGL